jgi:uncharacterized OsmC-like protein
MEIPMTLNLIADAWGNLCEAIRANPDRARAKYGPAIASLESGLRCQVMGPSGEQVETDMPPAMGGAGSRPNPGWLFRASLAACCATVTAAQAARLGIKLTRLQVAVEGEGDNRGILGLDDSISAGHSIVRTVVQISADKATPSQLDELVRWAMAHSPVSCTVRDATPSMLSIIVT